jgi:glyoxylase-like metal-dependent hydrolase (beta-lactamase superfamily II)
VEIVDGLHQLKTPMAGPALPYMMPYAFEEADGVGLFDAGFGTPDATRAMQEQLAALGYEPKHIRRLIVSHAHPDHLGMARWVKDRAPDAQLVMLGREWQWIQDRWLDNESWTRLSDEWLVHHGVPRAEVDEAHAQAALGPTSPRVRPGAEPAAAPARPAAAKATGDGEEELTLAAAEEEAEERAAARRSRAMPGFDIEPDVKLEDGETYAFDRWRLQAVWTPGHTPGHLCMYEPDRRLMFTGDHVLPHISPNVSLHADQEGTSPLSDFRDSLRKVAAFDVDLALPAHEFTIPDLRARVAVLLHHHDARLEEVRNAIGAAPATAREISQRVKWNTGPFDDFNIFMKRSALGETLSHLRLLQDEERVLRVEDDGAVRWAQT